MKHCPNRQCPFLLENQIPSEFRDDIEVCPDCGTLLADGEAPPMESEVVLEGDFRTLCTVQTREDAEYLQENLAAHDVAVTILPRAELEARSLYVDENGAYGLVVLDREYVRANRILDLILDEGEEEEVEDDVEYLDEEDPDAESEEWEEDEASDEPLTDLLYHFADCQHSWLATVRPDGRPHLTPVWHLLHNGLIYISTTSTTVKAANVQRNPQVALAANEDDPDDGLLIEGTARFRPELREELEPLFAEKYALPTLASYNHDTLLEITPAKLIAWGQYGEGRWQAEEIHQAALQL